MEDTVPQKTFYFESSSEIKKSLNFHLVTEKGIYFRNVFLMSPMALRSLNLPGVGTKYEFETDKGDTVAIFFTKTGSIQMYTLQKGCNTPSAAEMTPVEARRLGNILTGAIIEADQESVEIAFSALADLQDYHPYVPHPQTDCRKNDRRSPDPGEDRGHRYCSLPPRQKYHQSATGICV